VPPVRAVMPMRCRLGRSLRSQACQADSMVSNRRRESCVTWTTPAALSAGKLGFGSVFGSVNEDSGAAEVIVERLDQVNQAGGAGQVQRQPDREVGVAERGRIDGDSVVVPLGDGTGFGLLDEVAVHDRCSGVGPQRHEPGRLAVQVAADLVGPGLDQHRERATSGERGDDPPTVAELFDPWRGHAERSAGGQDAVEGCTHGDTVGALTLNHSAALS
jgi:hypothetical protein